MPVTHRSSSVTPERCSGSRVGGRARRSAGCSLGSIACQRLRNRRSNYSTASRKPPDADARGRLRRSSVPGEVGGYRDHAGDHDNRRENPKDPDQDRQATPVIRLVVSALVHDAIFLLPERLRTSRARCRPELSSSSQRTNSQAGCHRGGSAGERLPAPAHLGLVNGNPG